MVAALSSAVILGLDPRIKRGGALNLAGVAQADSPILGSSPRMTVTLVVTVVMFLRARRANAR